MAKTLREHRDKIKALIKENPSNDRDDRIDRALREYESAAYQLGRQTGWRDD